MADAKDTSGPVAEGYLDKVRAVIAKYPLVASLVTAGAGWAGSSYGTGILAVLNYAGSYLGYSCSPLVK
jgi:hypothetical protein